MTPVTGNRFYVATFSSHATSRAQPRSLRSPCKRTSSLALRTHPQESSSPTKYVPHVGIWIQRRLLAPRCRKGCAHRTAQAPAVLTSLGPQWYSRDVHVSHRRGAVLALARYHRHVAVLPPSSSTSRIKGSRWRLKSRRRASTPLPLGPGTLTTWGVPPRGKRRGAPTSAYI